MKVILQLAECGSFFSQVDLFKVRGKFALSDAFEDHFILPKGRIVMITHRRVILLQVSYSVRISTNLCNLALGGKKQNLSCYDPDLCSKLLTLWLRRNSTQLEIHVRCYGTSYGMTW